MACVGCRVEGKGLGKAWVVVGCCFRLCLLALAMQEGGADFGVEILFGTLPSRTARLLLLLLLLKTSVLVADGAGFEMRLLCVWLWSRQRVCEWGAKWEVSQPCPCPGCLSPCAARTIHPPPLFLHTYTKDTATRAGREASPCGLSSMGSARAVRARGSYGSTSCPCSSCSPSYSKHCTRLLLLPRAQSTSRSHASWAYCGVALLSCSASARPAWWPPHMIESIIRLRHTNTQALPSPHFSFTQVIPSPNPFLNHVWTPVDELQCGPGEEPPPDQGHDLPHGLHPR